MDSRLLSHGTQRHSNRTIGLLRHVSTTSVRRFWARGGFIARRFASPSPDDTRRPCRRAFVRRPHVYWRIRRRPSLYLSGTPGGAPCLGADVQRLSERAGAFGPHGDLCRYVASRCFEPASADQLRHDRAEPDESLRLEFVLAVRPQSGFADLESVQPRPILIRSRNRTERTSAPVESTALAFARAVDSLLGMAVDSNIRPVAAR